MIKLIIVFAILIAGCSISLEEHELNSDCVHTPNSCSWIISNGDEFVCTGSGPPYISNRNNICSKIADYSNGDTDWCCQL